MVAQPVEYLDAVNHLPIGATLSWPGFRWQDFEALAAQLGDRRDVRLSYYQGKVEIARPSPEHEEEDVDLIQDLTRLLVREMGLRLESRGTALLKRKLGETGAQPDGCFYIQHAARIIGKRTLDLAVDPPPDIVVEVDLSSRSLGKFPLYAALNIPEIWRYDGTLFEIYHLGPQGYVTVLASRAFPLLTAAVMTEFLAQSKQIGQDETLMAFQAWLKQYEQTDAAK